MAVYFHLKYDTFDGCLCMNGANIIPTAKRYLNFAKNKKFYLFHGEQNKYVPMHTVKHTQKKLEQNEAIVYLKSYPELSYYLTSMVYSQAIDTILQDDDNEDLQSCHSAFSEDLENDTEDQEKKQNNEESTENTNKTEDNQPNEEKTEE